MCIGIPGQIVALDDAQLGTAWVDVCGVRRSVNIMLVAADEQASLALIGHWVLVHVGFAMSRLDEDEALETLQLLQEMGEVENDVRAFLGQRESH
ncbi:MULTISPECIES: HypC/HybG/HupF family hydrogenase formation chaperone [Yersinia]|uniref:HypC/HybG/HupF family hydrogenase formation chaperone n=1 Tax=Yersinia TaxID=629 RepID=UPI0005DE590A|nr:MULTISPECIES: HypC/HybG/HupF family hydrogenase formation chaperone [Yersinia]OVZ94989.1 hydrogenase [Yersinia frederiksenii]RXA97786.1 HypC/HybG/HupF family hydrogenase formation chaperone [Yersinia sp. 2105 StPb PI]CNI38115.1 putative hydrogenase isoenzymes formation protein [Yersinia frederiksenii]CNJ13555.1 putative hydrogenase isoenzymes formation protein [Yersinia frederiksenii]